MLSYIIINANELQLERDYYTMKKKLAMLLGIMLLLVVLAGITIHIIAEKSDREAANAGEQLRIISTFYPVYMIGLNLTEGMDGVQIDSLTDLNTGCLHDYQLTTEDMKLISNADVMIINGGGMEGFLEDVMSNYPQLAVIDASEGITMLSSEEDHHDHDADEHDDEHSHGEWNAHVWLDPQLYIRQINNVAEGLKGLIHSDSIEKNADAYIAKIEELDAQIAELKRQYEEKFKEGSGQQAQGMQAVIFHDAFLYLANRVGISVAHTVTLDSDTALSAGEIAEIVEEVKQDKIRYLFTEEQFSDSIAGRIAAETGATVSIIDSAVTGDGASDSYLRSMQKNIDTLTGLIQ